MVIRILVSLLLAGAASAVFGRYYIPWLKKKNFEQPLKEEVAKIYTDRSRDD